MSDFPHTPPRYSATFTPAVNAEIRRAAASGIYDIRGGGTKRHLPHFDDLLFLGASISRYPLEGYREKCATDVWLGTRFAKKPIHLDIPVTIAGMSFGALSGPAKEALGRGASEAGTSTTTGDGGMTEEERGHSKTLVYQYLPSRYGMNPDDLRRCDAIEVVVGQGAKPGGGGMLLGQKISDRVAMMRNLPKGIDQRSACRHPDWTGPDDLEIKIHELREITSWEKPIYVKVGGARPYYDVALAVKSGADVVVVDGMQARLYDAAAFADVRRVISLDDAVILERAHLAAGARPTVQDAGSNIGRRVSLYNSAQLLGVAEAALKLAVEYAGVREQFGQAIGSFQSIKHRCADMAVAAEAAFAQVFFAGVSQASGQPDAAYQIAAAKVTSAGAALANARSGIQIHGGTGFTAECDAHVFLKRAHLLGQLGGERHWIRETLLTQALDDRVSLG
jgi:hypothetical protein